MIEKQTNQCHDYPERQVLGNKARQVIGKQNQTKTKKQEEDTSLQIEEQSVIPSLLLPTLWFISTM